MKRYAIKHAFAFVFIASMINNIGAVSNFEGPNDVDIKTTLALSTTSRSPQRFPEVLFTLSCVPAGNNIAMKGLQSLPLPQD